MDYKISQSVFKKRMSITHTMHSSAQTYTVMHSSAYNFSSTFFGVEVEIESDQGREPAHA